MLENKTGEILEFEQALNIFYPVQPNDTSQPEFLLQQQGFEAGDL